jgi:hypothetical protein
MVQHVTHKHHIIPRYEGGSDDPSNIVELRPVQHAMWHFAEWQRKKNPKDKLAWKLLSQEVTSEERFVETRRLGGTISGPITRDQKIGIHGLTNEQIKENAVKGGKAGGQRNKELYYDSKEGFFSKESREKAIEVSRENKSGRFDSGLQSELGKRAAKKNRENGTGAFFDADIQSEAGKKGSKVTNSQRWRCTKTGHISTSGPLSCYQKARGIDTSFRERVNG